MGVVCLLFVFFFAVVIWIGLPSECSPQFNPSGRLMFFILSVTLAVILNAINYRDFLVSPKVLLECCIARVAMGPAHQNRSS